MNSKSDLYTSKEDRRGSNNASRNSKHPAIISNHEGRHSEPRNTNPWIHLQEGRGQDWLRLKTSCPEEIGGDRLWPTPEGHKMTSGKSFVSTVIKKGISLAIAPRNSDNPANDASGNHTLALVEIDRLKSSQLTNKYARSVMTAPLNKEPKTGSPTSLMSKTTLKSSSCNRCWEQKGRIFKTLKSDGLGESYSL